MKELRIGCLTKEDSGLVVCGDNLDRVTLREDGFKNVVISNLASHKDQEDYSPFSRMYQDAENLDCADDSYDVIIVYSGLHHCSHPHRGLAYPLWRAFLKNIPSFNNNVCFVIQKEGPTV